MSTMEQIADGNDSYGFDMSSNYMSQPPQIFGAYHPDGSPVPPVLSGSIFGDSNEQGSVDENDPKRRRIARVSEKGPANIRSRVLTSYIGLRYVPEKESKTTSSLYLTVTDLEEHRSSVTGECQPARTASITKRSAYLHTWKRSAINRKGR